MTSNPLAQQFTLKSLLKFTLPSIFMMLFMSTYSIIDGVFVASLVGEEALAATNIIMPLLGILMALALMFATGGNAIIAKFMGEGKPKEACQFMTIIYIIGAALGLIFSIFTIVLSDQMLNALSVSEDLYPYAKDYLLSLAAFAAPIFFQIFIQSFIVTVGRPGLGLILSLTGGIINIILDYLLISPNFADLGITGAGLATGIGNSVPGIIGVFYLAFNKKSELRFMKPNINLKLIGQSMFNGSSELVGSLATSITTMMFNFILLDIAGSAGVAAISVILYIQMFQNAIYMGFSMGVAPIIAFKFGEKNRQALQSIIKQSLKVIAAASLIVISLTLVFADQAIGIFIDQASPTFDLAKNGLLLFLPAYLFMGFNIFLSSMFTSLSNGKVSAAISVARSLVFIVISLLILPLIWGINGVWLAVPVAEFLAIIVAYYFYKAHRHNYGY